MIYFIFLFSLLVPDLRPNVGLFWYFFTEMFEHFRPLFVCAFQINCFLYVAPLALRLRKEPMLLAFSLAALSTVFRSYPSVGDLGFYLGMLPIWLHLLPCNVQNFHKSLLMK
jgi:GPI-anchor transamidase subunit U